MKSNETTYTDHLHILPKQMTGKEIVAEQHISLKDINEAKYFYQAAKKRLLDVNKWHEIAGAISAQFKVFDQDGNSSRKEIVEKGNLIRIDIPGPGSTAGDGYDWVHVEELKQRSDKEIESIGFRVRPHHAPNKTGEFVAHFYGDDATSSFILTREGNEVAAFIVDRNIKPNDEDQPSLAGKVRDLSVALGAIGAFSKIQWQKLAEGIVEASPEGTEDKHR